MGFYLETEAAEVLSFSRYIILDEVDSSAKDKTPYLQRGSCFLECLLCMLTGSLAPRRESQFADLDAALGIELGASTTMRRYFRQSADNPHRLVNSLCVLLRRKF